MSDAAADIDRVWTLVKEIPIAMVVTHEGEQGNMRGRPMAARPSREEGAIYFLTDVDSPKADEIRNDDVICLAWADHRKKKYLSITGRGEIIDNRDRIKQIWSIFDKAFWPDESDPRIRILRVTPESAEFWEGAGALVTAVKLVAASVSGERMKSRQERKGWIRVVAGSCRAIACKNVRAGRSMREGAPLEDDLIGFDSDRAASGARLSLHTTAVSLGAIAPNPNGPRTRSAPAAGSGATTQNLTRRPAVGAMFCVA